MKVKVRFYGLVQGVGFRAFAQRNAEELGVRGWIRNRKDGSVEALFCGEGKNVFKLVRRLVEDHPLARVDKIEIVISETECPEKFIILPTV